MFPEKTIKRVVFPFPFAETNIDKANEYIISQESKGHIPFILGDPKNAKNIDQYLKKAKGVRVYADQISPFFSRVSINEMAPEHIMKSIDKNKSILMLHLPRNGIGNKDNLMELQKISSKYSHARIILAHFGVPSDIKSFEESLNKIRENKNIFLDTSMVTDPKLIEKGIKIMGVDRVLFGSDIPFGIVIGKEDVVSDKKTGIERKEFMTLEKYPWQRRENRENLARKKADGKTEYVVNVYHSIDAIKKASKELGLSEEDIKKIFYKNAKKLVGN